MKDDEIILDEYYNHSIFGKIQILANVTDQWEYFSKQGISVWRAQQFFPRRTVLCINSKYFENRRLAKQ
jgi:hypothetical protein